MKTKLALLTAFFLFIVVRPVLSQDNKFIEISASDTVELKPLSIIYQLSLKAQYDYMGYTVPVTGSDTIHSPSTASLAGSLKKNKFSYEISDNNTYAITNNVSIDTVLLVSLTSETELKRLIKTLVPFKGISGKVKDIKYEPFSKYSNGLYKNLYAKALADATAIAAITGNTIGKLISVEEPKDSLYDYINSLGDLYKEYPFNKDQNNLNKKIVKKLIFKFQML